MKPCFAFMGSYQQKSDISLVCCSETLTVLKMSGGANLKEVFLLLRSDNLVADLQVSSL